MKRILFACLTLAGLAAASALAISLDDIPLWTGSGTNRAGLVIEWNTPLLFNSTTVPAPIATKTMVWGYRFNGATTGLNMIQAILASDPRLYAVEAYYPGFGHFVESLGYNLNANGQFGVSDGTNMYETGNFTSNCLINPELDVDAAYPLNSNDLFWSGYFGPNWQLWTELGDSGGGSGSPDRGASQYWDPSSYTQGQWALADYGMDDLTLTNGSWLGFSVGPDGYPSDPSDPNYAEEMQINTNDVQAPPDPDGTYTAYVLDTNDYAVQVISSTNIYPNSPYNNTIAVLGRPTLSFDDIDDTGTTDRVTIIDPPYNKTPGGADVITEISSGGELTLKMGRKVYHNPNNPYGEDFIVYGNSLFSVTGGTSGLVSDSTDLDSATIGSSPGGHGLILSVSPDGSNWYTFPETASIFADNSYRWDDTNASWTDEEMNPTKPLNPYLYTNNFSGLTAAAALDQFTGAMGGTGYNLAPSGFGWIQYVRLQPPSGTSTVIDAVAAVDPAVIGDALSISPDNISAGMNTLCFQNPANTADTVAELAFQSVSVPARVSVVSLANLSSYAPVPGVVTSACRVMVRPVLTGGTLQFQAAVSLTTGATYAGNGSDLRVYEWCGSNWVDEAFTFNRNSSEASVAGVTNCSAFVVSQIVDPEITALPTQTAASFQFLPVPNCAHILERSLDLTSWTPIATNSFGGGQPVTVTDPNPPAGHAYYRLIINVP